MQTLRMISLVLPLGLLTLGICKSHPQQAMDGSEAKAALVRSWQIFSVSCRRLEGEDTVVMLWRWQWTL